MRKAPLVAVLALLAATTQVDAAEFVIDDFDGGQASIAGAAVISPTPGTMLAGGDMFEVGNYNEVLANASFGLPFAVADDSLVGAALNGMFEFDSAGIFGGQKTDNFFALSDIENDDNLGGTATVEWTIDVTGLTGMQLQVDIGAMGDFESSDQFSFDVSFDGGANYAPVMAFTANEDIEHTYRPLDDQHRTSFADFDDSGQVDGADLQTWQDNFGMVAVDPDPDPPGDASGNGTTDGFDFLIWQRDFGPATAPSVTTLDDPLVYTGPDMTVGTVDDIVLDKTERTTGVLDSITAPITGTGTSMILRFMAAQNSGSEAVGFDNVVLLADDPAIAAVPEPSTIAIALVALVAGAGLRRRS